MTEREEYRNALLTISLGSDIREIFEGHLKVEPKETDGETMDLYTYRMAIPDSVFDTDTDVTLIPDFTEGRLPHRIKDICVKYALVFKKSLTAEKRKHFKPVTLPLIIGAKPDRPAGACRRTPLHWKRTMDEILDALLESDMIEKVPVLEGAGDFLFEAFLVPRLKDPIGPLG